jgi:UTP--glucose-1-phosphate uridylyltransferase
MNIYECYKSPVLTAYPVDDEGTKKYGIIDGEKIEANVIKVKNIVEKPGPVKAPSRIATLGGYILTPDIFDVLRKTALGKGKELWLVDAIFSLAKKRPIYASLIKGKYYDVGSKIGWLKANIDYALEYEETATFLREYLGRLINEL